ncbi:MAG: hypothetical protein MUE32_09665 [Bacteroidales bacterium]|jgi:hypothetical protein|nr:hypothetical protein [Bacteroidales bacterium]
MRTVAAALAMVLVFLVAPASAQYVPAEKPPLRERMFFGGTFWLSFGNVSNIEIAPIVGLWVLPRLAVAGGPEYQFFKYYDQKTSIYGGKAYAQLVLLKDLNNLVPLGVHTGIFLHVEDELLSLDSSYWPVQYPESGRTTVNTVLAGGGISQQLGRRSSINFIIIWALNDAGYGVYDNPEIRLSFNF